VTYTATITARDANTTTGIEGSIDADITRDGAHLCSVTLHSDDFGRFVAQGAGVDSWCDRPDTLEDRYGDIALDIVAAIEDAVTVAAN